MAWVQGNKEDTEPLIGRSHPLCPGAAGPLLASPHGDLLLLTSCPEKAGPRYILPVGTWVPEEKEGGKRG